MAGPKKGAGTATFDEEGEGTGAFEKEDQGAGIFDEEGQRTRTSFITCLPGLTVPSPRPAADGAAPFSLSSDEALFRFDPASLETRSGGAFFGAKIGHFSTPQSTSLKLHRCFEAWHDQQRMTAASLLLYQVGQHPNPLFKQRLHA